ncbi:MULTISPECIES: ABC transporter ATP-binding protein [unclassified Flavobacterium]|uniref:ABC transporter ATP-binding protein n=2 Tax=Flavobacterium TaxID=237 RepID=UPI001291B39D|nr:MULTISPECIES: ABC transporter ATP-binding protein [unclassified Flavobacterium]MQP52035.1 ATP-binding cassette domain-containing protein [Flavobacterium sp. LMO9]MQP61904.1 ATP-binding cassette domain-containing protein [Flavobacterium sp. LMO6]
MSKVVIKAENISKQYRLGLVGTGTVKDDMKRWWYNLRGKEDPFLKIGEANDRASKGESDYVWSLRDINFEINQGDSVGIIGRNGAGKSTLLKILSQVTQPTTGKIYTKGRIASLLEVGTGFHPEMTGRENIYLNGAILGMRKHEITRKLDEIIAFSGVERYIDTPVKRYSSGMYVRLAFAVAAHLESEILIVDEVLAVGDVEFQKKCLGKMNDVSKGEGRTVLFVSHNMAAVKSLCTKGIVLEHGRVVFNGNSEDAINYYLDDAYKTALKPVMEREDRKGNKKLLVNAIYVENKEGIRVAELHSGEEYCICFDYTKSKYIDPKQLTVVVQFKNDNDELVTTIATDELGTQFSEIAEKGKIELHIPKLQFREGNYSLTYMISEKLAFNTPHEVIDYLSDACVVSVIRGDYWKSGILNRPKGFIQEASIKLI